MNETSIDRIAASREGVRAFGQQYDYDTTEIRDGKIAAIFAHRNPDKLRTFEN